MSAVNISFLVIALHAFYKGDAKMKTVAFNSDILTKFAAAHGTKFAIPCQRKCRLICNAFPTDSSDYN